MACILKIGLKTLRLIMESRKNILKYSPERLKEYESWIKEGRPIKFALFTTHLSPE